MCKFIPTLCCKFCSVSHRFRDIFDFLPKKALSPHLSFIGKLGNFWACGCGELWPQNNKSLNYFRCTSTSVITIPERHSQTLATACTEVHGTVKMAVFANWSASRDYVMVCQYIDAIAPCKPRPFAKSSHDTPSSQSASHYCFITNVMPFYKQRLNAQPIKRRHIVPFEICFLPAITGRNFWSLLMERLMYRLLSIRPVEASAAEVTKKQ